MVELMKDIKQKPDSPNRTAGP